jgi:hypothetical protein
MTDIYVKYSPRNFKENRLNYEISESLSPSTEAVSQIQPSGFALRLYLANSLGSRALTLTYIESRKFSMFNF